jgi:hypothetical protein
MLGRLRRLGMLGILRRLGRLRRLIAGYSDWSFNPCRCASHTSRASPRLWRGLFPQCLRHHVQRREDSCPDAEG